MSGDDRLARGFTIDDFYSTDLDDAVWAEPHGDGTRVLVTRSPASPSISTPARRST